MQALKTKHAVVLGGSIAGLLAAHVLSRHFTRVTIVERDRYPAVGEPRKGVPQGRQLHALLAGGRRALDAMFPDFSAGLVRRGALDVDAGTCGTFYVADRALPHVETGLRSLLMSRPLLEGYIRELVLAHSNVTTREQCVGQALLGDAAAVSGVRIAHVSSEQTEDLVADLVVDATGRGSRLPDWLVKLGARPPSEDRVTMNLTYMSLTIRRRPQDLAGQPMLVVNPTAPRLHSGAALAIEGDRYIIAATSYLDEPTPTDYPSLVEYARSLPGHGLYDLLRDAEPLTEAVKMRMHASQRRRYERLSRFPRGLLVCGDALCSFNALYGQGMTVAALEAQTLDACLQSGTHRLFQRFTSAAAKLVDVPWSIVVGGDYAFEGVKGKRTLAIRITNAYINQVMGVASIDPVVSRAFLSVTHLCAPPSLLFSPSILWRVFKQRNDVPSALQPLAAESLPDAVAASAAE